MGLVYFRGEVRQNPSQPAQSRLAVLSLKAISVGLLILLSPYLLLMAIGKSLLGVLLECRSQFQRAVWAYATSLNYLPILWPFCAWRIGYLCKNHGPFNFSNAFICEEMDFPHLGEWPYDDMASKVVKHIPCYAMPNQGMQRTPPPSGGAADA